LEIVSDGINIAFMWIVQWKDGKIAWCLSQSIVEGYIQALNGLELKMY
jgi:hypothetical protein